jgi:hypothetical protein
VRFNYSGRRRAERGGSAPRIVNAGLRKGTMERLKPVALVALILSRTVASTWHHPNSFGCSTAAISNAENIG